MPTVTVRYFAVVREALGRDRDELSLPDGATAGDALDAVLAGQPALDRSRRSLLLMVNQAYAPPGTPLADGDEVALIPPVSGGSGGAVPNESTDPAGDDGSRGRLFRVTDQPLDPREAEAAVADPSCGAILTFTGAVRDNARGQAVTELAYEAYAEAAERMMATIADEIAELHGVERVAILHRVGVLGPGEASVVISVASPHRPEAFDAGRHAIERLKEIVPIWKKEHYRDGSTWIGSESDYRRQLAADGGVEGTAADDELP